jgi:SAM-dependent methyltransferase
MKNRLRKIRLIVAAYNLFRQIAGFANYLKDYVAFKKLSARTALRFPLFWKDRYPCLLDRTAKTEFDRHYTYHPAWAARILAETKPAEHVDISSLLQFSTLISAFIPVRFFDYRPAALHLSNLTSESADLLALPFADGYLLSVSCMHVVEHVGLGRYGDTLDPDGDMKAIAELKRVLAPGGTLLFVVPIGQSKIMFNAHRIYSYQQITALFANYELKEFALVPDNPEEGGLIRDATQEMADKQKYGCGCFWFQKVY